ncbi:MAG: hypothetical protein GF384_04980 [Elusimicrobia bacterium]|nr:hypothetical protein [Elusimicrobiota bacterium]MBD3412149.1 hypothetical protein [Elusimicrobiota bacterium]
MFCTINFSRQTPKLKSCRGVACFEKGSIDTQRFIINKNSTQLAVSFDELQKHQIAPFNALRYGIADENSGTE